VPTDDISASVSVDAAAAALVPADMKAKGTLTVAMDLTSPPTTFLADDNVTPVGFNPDMARLIAKKLGLKLTFDNVKFATIIPGLAADRYDFTASTMGINPDRLKVVDMITYFNDGNSIAAAAGNPKNLTTTTLCGSNIAVVAASTQETKLLPAMSKKCTDAGKSAIQATVLPSVQDCLTQLASKRVDGIYYDSPALAWAATKQPNAFQVLTPAVDDSPAAIATKKGSAFTPALQAAIQSIIKDDALYQKALNRWNLNGLGIKTAQLDPTDT
jgi:polar amino acid transport system substrate-binding protein